jgi:transaldolase/glucose-6-phosphate isomerase
LARWQTDDRMARLWARDASLWSGTDEARWLGWLDVVQRSLHACSDLDEFARGVVADGFTHVVLLGMGGSSMAPEVLCHTFGVGTGFPQLTVLDSTDPAQIRAVQGSIDVEHTLFIISSKSGSSLEPNILKDYFYRCVVDRVGETDAPGRFVAITDPGSSLDKLAGDEGFRRVFHGEPEIGGRFSALSNFGLVPAALIGVDCRRLLEQARTMVESCSPGHAAADNPALLAGIIMGEAARQGRDKLTLVISPGLASLGAWLEQLVAESTGKQGKGIIPVDGEPLSNGEGYGDDRLFAYLRLATGVDPEQDRAMEVLVAAGQPVMRIDIEDIYGLGQEFFRWEMATAVAGAVLGVNPFDQPDVEASKVESRKITAVCESGGSLPCLTPLAEEESLALYTDPANTAALHALCGEHAGVGDYLQAHLGRTGPGDYLALLAYLARNENNVRQLQSIRAMLRCHSQVATCIGFGPRFLHSTGQAYKGGSNTGVFLQLTSDAVQDLPVPGRHCTFGTVEAAQACGDFEVLAERGRRLLRVHLGADVDAGLEQLATLLDGLSETPATDFGTVSK